MATAARVLDGKKLATEIKAKLASQIKSENLQLGLGTILVGSDPSSHSYVAGKHRDCAEVGIKSIRVELPESASESEILSAVAKLNGDSSCTGFIVQLPLPKGVNGNKVLESIDPSKDAFELVSQNGISWEGKDVVIVGRGTTVGRPLSLLLSGKGANATVTIAHSKTVDLNAHLKRAEIIVAALGKPNFLKSEMLREGAVVIDVGLTRIGEKLVGDVDPSVYEKASAYSPVPGGVGPLTRAMLLSNVLELARKSFN
ncbi:MAG: bifunctional methylenetetrahydrofolate dehydrogenase/methenyltetrahydrofolate cyclohydrolase [Actinobacteria bacterium]|nr:bifunctional methylenetetrahydrofolate dehydrogenase/methenyltetrahydrofolate cyclohydrolase [Actinomycetota bacterium]